MKIQAHFALLVLLCLALGGCLRPAGIRYPGLPNPSDGALHIINFNVDQADAMLIIYNGRTLLVDCGAPLGKPELTAQRIPRRLDALLGHRHIDYFVITHYHQDHFHLHHHNNISSSSSLSTTHRHHMPSIAIVVITPPSSSSYY